MAPINVTTSKQQITASVAEDKVTANVSAGFGATGPQGPSGVITVTAPITNSGTTTAANVGLSVGTGLAVSGGSLVLGTHTHDDRYYTETEVNNLLAGYATLVGGKVPAAQLPSYVDDVVEVATFGQLPSPGETGKIYVVLQTNKVYRWTGFVYLEIVASPGTTDALAEGNVNLYHTTARAAAAAPVQSVAGRTGAVVLGASDIVSGTLSASRLPIASAGSLGGVRIGSGVTIDPATGVISASSGYTLPTASANTLGGVKIGSGITITDGVISVSSASVAWNDISGKPTFATVATSGSYADLTNVPSTFAPSAHAASHAVGGADPLFDQDLNTTDAVEFGGLKVTGFSDNENDPVVEIVTTGGQAPLTFKVSSTPQAYVKADDGGNLAVAAKGAFIVETDGFGAQYERMRVSEDGVGIATTSPEGALHVVGSVIFADAAATTKSVTFDISPVTAGQRRTLSVPDESGTLALTSDARFTDARTPTAHSHSAADVTSGVFDVSLLPVGTGSTQVAAGDHTHAQLHDRSHAITSSSDHTATAWRLFYSNGSGVITELTLGSSGQALLSNGASAAPSWGSAGSNSASDLTTGTLANARMTTRARASMNLYLWSSFR